MSPSWDARLAVGMDTQKVESVVTIWLMPSMIDFAKLPMASSSIPETALPP